MPIIHLKVLSILKIFKFILIEYKIKLSVLCYQLVLSNS